MAKMEPPSKTDARCLDQIKNNTAFRIKAIIE